MYSILASQQQRLMKSASDVDDYNTRATADGGTIEGTSCAIALYNKQYELNPILSLIPSDYKATTLYTAKPNTAVGDFDVARAGIKTRINSDLKLEEIAANVPALNYATVGGCPHLNTEPARTNLLGYSESFGNSYWTKSGATIEGDASTAGSELVTNGDFATYTDWSNTGGAPNWEISGGKLKNTAAGNLNQSRQDISFEVGKKYLITYTISDYVSGIVHIDIGDTNIGLSRSGNGTYVETIEVVYPATFIDIEPWDALNTTSCELSLDNVSVKQVSGFPSPSVDYPTDAYKLVEDGTTGVHGMLSQNITVTSTAVVTESIYIKAGERNWVRIEDNSTGYYVYYDCLNNVFGTESGTITYSSEALVDGWFRVYWTTTQPATVARISILLASADGSFSYTGDGTSGLYIFGANLSETTYAPPYAYTNGATATVTADAITGAGDATLFSSVNSSGVLYAEIGALADDGTNRWITISDGTFDNYISIYFDATSNNVSGRIFGSSTNIELSHVLTDETAYNKIAVRWNGSSFGLWVNGVEEATSSSAGVISGLNEILFGNAIGGSPFYGNTRQVAVYNYLTDAECISLTTP